MWKFIAIEGEPHARYRRVATISLVLLINLLTFSRELIAQSRDLKKIRIANPGPSMSYFPIYVAQQKGFFKKHGIEAEFILMSSGPTSVAALLNREIDYSTVLGPAATTAVRGAPLKVICFTSVKLQHSLFARPDIFTPKDLSNKRIGVGPLRSLTWYEVQFVIQKYGLQNTTIIAAGQNQRSLAALQAGGIDAAIISVPLDIKAEEMGLRRLIRMGDILPVPQVGLAATEDKIKKNPEEVLRVLRATIDGLTYVRSQSNRQDVINIVAKWINLSVAQSEKAFVSVEDTFSQDCIPDPGTSKRLSADAKSNH